jgi:outer membrane immunogenic protein
MLSLQFCNRSQESEQANSLLLDFITVDGHPHAGPTAHLKGALMKKLLLGTVAGVALLAGGSANAADLPVKAYKAPPIVAPPPVLSWTGCYIGGNVGEGKGFERFHDNTSFNTGFGHTTFFGGTAAFVGSRSDITNSFSGIVGGGQIGCNYQFYSSWVVGIEGMWDGTNMRGSNVVEGPLVPFDLGNGTFVPLDTHALVNTKVDWLASITGRIGYTWNQMMVYGKGGVAWARFKHDVETDTVLAPFDDGFLRVPFGLGPQFEQTDTRTGWTAGFGLEWHFAPNVTAFVEYDYYGFGSHDRCFNNFDNNVVTTNNGCATFDVINNNFFLRGADVRLREDIQTVKLGFNILWSWEQPYGAPVVSRY